MGKHEKTDPADKKSAHDKSGKKRQLAAKEDILNSPDYHKEAVRRRLLRSIAREGFNKTHPEKRKGETFLCNIEPDKLDTLHFTSKRAGETAYSVLGTVLKGKIPVFVSQQELHEEITF